MGEYAERLKGMFKFKAPEEVKKPSARQEVAENRFENLKRAIAERIRVGSKQQMDESSSGKREILEPLDKKIKDLKDKLSPSVEELAFLCHQEGVRLAEDVMLILKIAGVTDEEQAFRAMQSAEKTYKIKFE